MKIKAFKMKPGMVIGIDREDDFKDICLVLSKKGHVEVEYTHLDLQQSYGGAMIGTINGKEKVKVIKGKMRQAAIKEIKREVFSNLHDIKHLIDMIRLIESLS